MSLPRDLILVVGLTTFLVACESMNGSSTNPGNDDNTFGAEETDPGNSGAPASP